MSERYEAVRLREGFLEHGFHGGGELTAIDEDYAGYVSRCLQGGLQDDSTSHAVADQHGGRQGECPHEFRDISDVPLDGAFRRRARTCPHARAENRRRPQCDHRAAGEGAIGVPRVRGLPTACRSYPTLQPFCYFLP